MTTNYGIGFDLGIYRLQLNTRWYWPLIVPKYSNGEISNPERLNLKGERRPTDRTAIEAVEAVEAVRDAAEEQRRRRFGFRQRAIPSRQEFRGKNQFSLVCFESVSWWK